MEPELGWGPEALVAKRKGLPSHQRPCTLCPLGRPVLPRSLPHHEPWASTCWALGLSLPICTRSRWTRCALGLVALESQGLWLQLLDSSEDALRLPLQPWWRGAEKSRIPSDLSESLFILPLQVGLLEVLVGKIFDLAFMPAMNGERGCPRAAWPGDQEVTGLLGLYDAQLFHLNSIPETFTLSLFISASECKYCPKIPSTSLFAAFVVLFSCPTLLD